MLLELSWNAAKGNYDVAVAEGIVVNKVYSLVHAANEPAHTVKIDFELAVEATEPTAEAPAEQPTGDCTGSECTQFKTDEQYADKAAEDKKK
jgi:hypothetical protein